MNYVGAFALCVSMTVMAALGDNAHLKYLILSDLNVGIFLYVAWLLEQRGTR